MRRAASLALLLAMVGCAAAPAPIVPVADTVSDAPRRHRTSPPSGTSLPPSTTSRLDDIARKVRELRDRSSARGD